MNVTDEKIDELLGTLYRDWASLPFSEAMNHRQRKTFREWLSTLPLFDVEAVVGEIEAEGKKQMYLGTASYSPYHDGLRKAIFILRRHSEKGATK